MDYKEFISQEERAIIKNLVHFIFKRLSEHSYLIQVNIATLEDVKKDYKGYKWTEATRIVTTVEAWCAYNNILEAGLK